MATALYRRYRPEAFAEMIGQAHVTEPLMTALRTGRVGHAYLFSGPRGCGKTTSARILARCLNCAEGPTDTPCGVCPSCVELSREGGGSLDVVEIDAASHGGVDDARELRERAVFAPARDRFKIFIIDEAHMVTSGGFNALLKIVEEPPPHVKFIFATTEPEKVIGTIRSRTHHYPFRLIAPAALIDYVQQLCDSEGVQIEPGVLPLVVRAGGGSVRDTLSILDQLIAGSESGGVTLERATGLLGFTSNELINETILALGAADSAAAFAATDRVVQTGQDPRRFVEDLLERLRDLIVIGATTVQGASAVFRGVPDDQLQRMFEQAQGFAPGQLSRIADTVADALDSMAGATAPRLQLELMIARALLVTVPAGSATPTSPAAGPESIPSAPASVPAAASAPAAGSSASGTSAASNGAVPATPSPAVDVIATMRSAREFLGANSAGTQRPPIVPLGGHAPQAPAAQPGEAQGSAQASETSPAESSPVEQPAAVPGAAGEAAAVSPDAVASMPASAAPAVGFDELLEAWPQLLEELLEADREAWNAVREVQPIALDGDLLTVGLASASDLDAFKASGAGPLREAIDGALGIVVKYKPQRVQAAPREPQPADAEPSPASPVAADEASPQGNSVAQPQTAQHIGLPDEPPSEQPDEPPYDEAPPGEFGDPGFDPRRDPDFDPQYDASIERAEAERLQVPADLRQPQTELDPVPASSPLPAVAPENRPARVAFASDDALPKLARYGEAVVREVLGARFIEEKPLPEGFTR